MSWNQYIEDLKKPNDQGISIIEEVAICGITPGQESVWASTPGFSNLTVEEIRTLANNRGKFAECGTHIAGKRCVLIRDSMDSNLTLDMKSAADCDGNSFGVCAGKSKQVMIVVRGAKDIRSGPLSDKVYNVCEHLRKANM